MSAPGPISAEQLSKHVAHLAENIGVRLAGTVKEQQAADYAASVLKDCGADVEQESFPVTTRQVTSEDLEILIGDTWQSFACSLLTNAPGTDGKWLEVPLVFFEAPAEYQRTNLSFLRGKAVVHLGSHIESRQTYRRLMEASPALLLFVDVRYPGRVPLADGLFPAYTQALSAVPTLGVAYMDAWNWACAGATQARVRVAGGMRPAQSQNVVAELPGQSKDLLLLSAHHDTQADSIGADDNATGVATLLELARLLAPLQRQRTLRLISFGTEEQLSVGSSHYVRQHHGELADRARLIFNIDSIGSSMGWNEMVCNGPPALEQHARSFLEDHDFWAQWTPEVMPYADHFPFVAAGVPGITYLRLNCTTGRFFHHQPDDDMSRISFGPMARRLDAVAAYLANLAQRPGLPFDSQIPGDQRTEIETSWTDLFGGWEA